MKTNKRQSPVEFRPGEDMVFEDRVLAGREVRLAGFIREQYLGTLTGAVQEVEGRNFECARAMVVLHGKLRRI